MLKKQLGFFQIQSPTYRRMIGWWIVAPGKQHGWLAWQN
jgi:hypothetical protein